jgi:hypothetical protein
LSGKAYFQLNGSVITNTSNYYNYYMLIVDGPEKVGTRVSGYSNYNAAITDLSGGTYTVVFYPYYATVTTTLINGKSVANYPVNTDCMVEKTIFIPEYIRPIINIPFSGGISCTNGLTNMTITVGQGSKPAFSYRYKVAGAADNTYTPANFQASNVFSNIAPGNYTIQVKDQCGSITTQDVRVFNGNEQFVGIVGEVKPGVICQGREVTLSVLSIGPVVSYEWSYSATGTGTWAKLASTGPTYVIESADQSHKGYYKVKINNGLCDLESQVHIIDVIPPAAKPSITGSTIICPSGSTVLTAQLSETIASPLYQWYKDGTAITGGNSATYTVTSAGSYTVDVTPYQGCPSDQSNAHVVTLLSLSQPTIASSATTICDGSSAILTATPNIASATYTWYRGGSSVYTSSTSNTYAATIAGTYTVTIGLTGCTSSASAGVTLTVNPSVTPSVVISAGTTGFEVCENAVSSIPLTATPTNGGSAPTYVWKVNGAQVGTGATYTLSNLKQYRPKATVTCTMTPNVTCPTSTTVADEKNVRISSCVIPVNPHIRGRILN